MIHACPVVLIHCVERWLTPEDKLQPAVSMPHTYAFTVLRARAVEEYADLIRLREY